MYLRFFPLKNKFADFAIEARIIGNQAIIINKNAIIKTMIVYDFFDTLYFQNDQFIDFACNCYGFEVTGSRYSRFP